MHGHSQAKDSGGFLSCEQAEAIAEKIGYAESILNDTALDEEYADVSVYCFLSTDSDLTFPVRCAQLLRPSRQ